MTSPIRIRSVYPFSAADRAWLGSIDSRIELIHDGEDTAEWVAALDDDQVQILWANYPPPTLEQTPRLLWLAMSSAGVDTVTSLDPWSLGLMVTNGSGLHAVGDGGVRVGGGAVRDPAVRGADGRARGTCVAS